MPNQTQSNSNSISLILNINHEVLIQYLRENPRVCVAEAVEDELSDAMLLLLFGICVLFVLVVYV